MTKNNHNVTRESSLYADSKSLKSYYINTFSADKPMRQVELEKGGYVYLKDTCNSEIATNKRNNDH